MARDDFGIEGADAGEVAQCIAEGQGHGAEPRVSGQLRYAPALAEDTSRAGKDGQARGSG